MKTYFLLAALLMIVSFRGNAQLKGFSIGPYAEAIWPTGNIKQTYSNGIGGGLNADIRIRKIGITASAGFIHFGGKAVTDNEGTTKTSAINALPVRAGIKYRFAPALYVKIQWAVARHLDVEG